jgi:hypothetical protein
MSSHIKPPAELRSVDSIPHRLVYKFTLSLGQCLVASLLCLTLQSAMGQMRLDDVLSQQQAQREIQKERQVDFLLWTAAAVGLLGLLAWRVRDRSQSAGRGLARVAMTIIVLDFGLAVVTGVALLGNNLLGLYLGIICYWAAIPHLVAMCILVVCSLYGGFNSPRAFVVGLGLLAPLLFFLLQAIDRGWSAPDLWTPSPERLSYVGENLATVFTDPWAGALKS